MPLSLVSCAATRRFAGVAVLLSVVGSAQAQHYRVTDHWHLTGDARWDYLTEDSENHTLYVTQGTQVDVLDSDTGKPRGIIANLKGTHGVALDGEGKYGYISDGGANAVVVFDRKTLATVVSIPAGTNPDGIAYEPVTRTVWAFNGRSQNATVIDTATNKAVATVALPGKPEFPAADGKGTVFVNIEDKDRIVRLDAATRTATATWPLPSCDSPSGLAMDRAHRRLFAVCDGGKMSVVDADSGKTVATPAIGDGPDAARFDPQRQVALSSNGQSGTLTVIREDGPDTYSAVEDVPTMKSARTLALDEKTGRVFLAAAEFGPWPAPTADNPHPRPPAIPATFQIVVVSPR
jgi:DNA-binding beta-propeller fold protein YncE